MPKGKPDTDLQATRYLWAEHQQGRTASQFRFDVVTKTKGPTCERHHVACTPEDLTHVGELVRVLERIVTNDCFLPRIGSWECRNCPYVNVC